MKNVARSAMHMSFGRSLETRCHAADAVDGNGLDLK